MTDALLPAPTFRAELRSSRADLWLRTTRGATVPIPAVPRPRDMDRRKRCRYSFQAFCETYHPDKFRDPTAFHIEFCDELQRMILSNSAGVRKHAVAAPRGIGKSTLVWMAIEWGVLYGHVSVAVVVGSNSDNAKDRISAIRNELLRNELLFEDFPEICGWVRDFDGDARRAPPNHVWSNAEMKLPNGSWAVAKGIDGSIPGLLLDGRRPDFVVIDDPETVSSIRSETETEALEARLSLEVSFLHERGGVGRYVLITTIRARNSISERYTDTAREPEWRGRRYKALIQKPANGLLWDTFGELFRREAIESETLSPAEEIPKKLGVALNALTPQCERALRFYLAHQAEMDAGAVLLDAERVPLWECYRTIHGSERGAEAFACELQNEPPEDENRQDTQLKYDYLIQRRLPILPARRVPGWAKYIRCQVDMGMYQIHWDCVAWGDNRAQAVVDCGIQDTGVNTSGALTLTDEKEARREMVELAIRRALRQLRERFAEGWVSTEGEIMFPAQIGIDIGGQGEQRAWMLMVLEHCRESGPQWIPLKGQLWVDELAKRSGGHNYMWDSGYYLINSDEYKHRLVRSYLVPAQDENGRPVSGSRVFSSGVQNEYLKHQTAERYQATFEPGKNANKSMRIGWHQYGKNHFFDCGHMSQALEDIFPGGTAPWKAPSAQIYVPGQGDE